MVSEDEDIKELRNSAQRIQGSLCTSEMLAVTRSSSPHRGAMALPAGWPSATSNHQQTHFPGPWDQNGSLLGSAPCTMLDFLIQREECWHCTITLGLEHGHDRWRHGTGHWHNKHEDKSQKNREWQMGKRKERRSLMTPLSHWIGPIWISCYIWPTNSCVLYYHWYGYLSSAVERVPV